LARSSSAGGRGPCAVVWCGSFPASQYSIWRVPRCARLAQYSARAAAGTPAASSCGQCGHMMLPARLRRTARVIDGRHDRRRTLVLRRSGSRSPPTRDEESPTVQQDRIPSKFAVSRPGGRLGLWVASRRVQAKLTSMAPAVEQGDDIDQQAPSAPVTRRGTGRPLSRARMINDVAEEVAQVDHAGWRRSR